MTWSCHPACRARPTDGEESCDVLVAMFNVFFSPFNDSSCQLTWQNSQNVNITKNIGWLLKLKEQEASVLARGKKEAK